MKGKIVLASVVVVLVAALALIIFSFHVVGNEQSGEMRRIGVVMPGSVSEEGWNGTHYKGVKAACDSIGVEISLVENIAEESEPLAAAVKKLIGEGIKLIVLGSYNYGSKIEQLMRDNPQVLFYCCSADLKIDNYKAYFARVYQARFLSGIVAGLQTKSGKIGYVAAMDNSEVNRGINAFTLGVRSVNPEAKVIVRWTGAWSDSLKETENANRLVDEGADVLAYHQNQTYVLDVAEARGVYSIGYHLEESRYSPKVLSSVSINWEMVYREFIQDFFQQKNNANMDYWVGIEKDAVRLSFLSDEVPEKARALLGQETMRIKSGKDVFSGDIYDNSGKKRCEKEEMISDDILRSNMDWFVAGVEIHED